MSSVFQKLSNSIGDYLTKRIKVNSLSTTQLKELTSLQKSFLTDIIEAFSVFDSKDLESLRISYLQKPKRNDKWDCKFIILDLKRELIGKAGLYEREKPFGAALLAAKTFLKIMDELHKNANKLIDSTITTVEGARITDVMMLGILRESDVFVKYTSYLWEYFRIVLEDGNSQVPYRSQYLLDQQEAYMSILNNICDKTSNYTFLSEIDMLKRKNADLLLNVNGTSFLSFLNRSNYTASNEEHVKHGIIGLNLVSRIVEAWDSWKHKQHQKTKMHREWLQQESFRLQEIIHDVNTDKASVQQTKKYLEAYSQEIAKLDAEIAKYEGGR